MNANSHTCNAPDPTSSELARLRAYVRDLDQAINALEVYARFTGQLAEEDQAATRHVARTRK
jgi:hypothetical protein